MHLPSPVNGVPLRAYNDGTTLVVIVEPFKEWTLWELASHVIEVRLTSSSIAPLTQGTLWAPEEAEVHIRFTDCLAELEFENSVPLSIPCESATVLLREYDTNDLRAKYYHLKVSMQATEECNSRILTQQHNIQLLLRKYVASHQRNWSAKRDFYVTKNPAKAAEFNAKLEVLLDMGKILGMEFSEPGTPA